MPTYDARQAIESIENRLVKIETLLQELTVNHLPHIYAELQRLGGRPSWVIMGIFAFLTSITSVLLTYIISHRGG